ncbi:uncharacterized protein LOC106053156 [Biomphalaria glabrata]|uniref:Uncharacterized protein LOC106053156 n=1 Tax=Biomphalaria glabrata TaxID=6526 RepID=A0A9W2Z2T2_BIOGL|nr:uncharacterized protein LOC106053156 [Biomphalaria glabrata]
MTKMTHYPFFSLATLVMTSQIFSLASPDYFTYSAYSGYDCDTILTYSSGVIYSPNYPHDYYDSLNCSWLILTNELSQISLNFTTLTTECCCDFVTVYDGNTTSAPQLGKLCSLQYNNFTSSGNSLLVTFSTDESVTSSGFFASYKILKNTKCESDKYICANSTRCLPRTVLCDGQTDCPEGEDEDRNVCARYCEPTDHQCTDGQCVPLQLFCNGTRCKDGSDDPENSLVMDVQPGVISQGLTINCSSYLLDTSCPDNWTRLTLARLNKTSQEFEDILRVQVDNKKNVKFISDEQIEDSDVSFGDFFVSLNVRNPQNGDEFKCEASNYDNYSKNVATQTQTYKVALNTTSAEDEDHENISTVQPSTVQQQFTEFLLSVFPPEVVDGFTDSLEITCRYRNAPLTNLFSLSILHSVSVEKPDFKYLCSVSSFNQKIQKHSPSLKSVNGTMDPIEGSHVSLIFEDPKVKKTGLYKCEVIGFDVEQGIPVIESKEFLVDAPDIKIETVIGQIRNETLLIRESLVSLQSESINSTERIKELQSSINQFKLDMYESISGLEADHDKTKNVIHNTTAFSNEFHNNLKSLNTSVSGLENNLNDLKTKFDKVEKLVNDNHKELDNIKNKSVSEDFIQKALQTMESSITQQKNFTQSAVDKSEAVKKRQDDMEGRLSKLDSGSKSFTQKPIESLFIGSSPFKGRRYWLTRKSYSILITDAETMCLRYGGYLLEIDSQDEFNFVRTFIQKNSAFTCVYTGGTDSLSENIWVHRFSLLKMKALNWHKGEPNNHVKEEHCECFFKAYNYFMNDCKCDFERHGNCGFICEIPEFDQDISSSISLGS